jgi:hypothetical protein
MENIKCFKCAKDCNLLICAIFDEDENFIGHACSDYFLELKRIEHEQNRNSERSHIDEQK